MGAIEALVIFLVIGAIAGWLAGLIVKGGGFGLPGDIVVGVLGAIIAGYLLPAVGVTPGGGLMGAILAALVGAIILLVVIKLVRRATSPASRSGHMLLIIARDAGRILMYSPRQLRHLAGTGRFPLLAQMRSADRVRRCLLLGVDRTYRGHHETDAIDPKRTSSL